MVWASEGGRVPTPRPSPNAHSDNPEEKDMNRMQDAIEKADDAFWALIAKAFPEITTGDFPPDATMAWHAARDQAVKTWLRWNMEHPVEGSRWTLTQTVDKYPHFQAVPGMVGTIMEADWGQVRLRMDAKLEGAEEWDNEIVWTVEDDDPDGISAVSAFMRDAELVQKTVATHALQEKDAVELQIEGNTVSVAHLTDGDGEHYVRIRGMDCDLEGEMPGEYYLKDRAPNTAGSVTLDRKTIHDAMKEADEALDGDSNDAEHDALYSLREQLSDWFERPGGEN